MACERENGYCPARGYATKLGEEQRILKNMETVLRAMRKTPNINPLLLESKTTNTRKQRRVVHQIRDRLTRLQKGDKLCKTCPFKYPNQPYF